LLDIIAKNPQQKSPATEINGRVVLQPHVWYTCPVGKIAKIKGRVVCTGLGAAGEARYSQAGIIVYRWQGSPPNLGMALPDDTSVWTNSVGTRFFPIVNMYRKIDVTLSAGQTIETNQDVGTNAEFNIFAEVIELPV